jgi:hypothetical protein
MVTAGVLAGPDISMLYRNNIDRSGPCFVATLIGAPSAVIRAVRKDPVTTLRSEWNVVIYVEYSSMVRGLYAQWNSNS